MVERVLQTMAEFFGRNHKGIYHALKVYGFARMIGLAERVGEPMMAGLECAAILHDIGKAESRRTYGTELGEYHAITGSRMAEELLGALDCPVQLRERICFLIGHHHSYGMDGGICLQILMEANLLVNLDEGTLAGSSPMEVKQRFVRTRTGRELISAMYSLYQPLTVPQQTVLPDGERSPSGK